MGGANKKTSDTIKNSTLKKQSKSKQLKAPDGYHRLNFLNQAAQLINSSMSINTTLANKINLHLGDVSQMVKDKYLIKTEPKRKRLECRRCHAQFSVKRKNGQYKIEFRDYEDYNVNQKIIDKPVGNSVETCPGTSKSSHESIDEPVDKVIVSKSSSSDLGTLITTCTLCGYKKPRRLRNKKTT